MKCKNCNKETMTWIMKLLGKLFGDDYEFNYCYDCRNRLTKGFPPLISTYHEDKFAPVEIY